MKAIYHQAGGLSLELFVIRDNGNGTVDLGREASGPVLFPACRVTAKPVPGFCTLISKPKQAAKE